jgi:hypothetical protein
MSKIVADLNEKHEANLKQIKRLGYILNEEVSTKPGQVTLAMDILQYLMWEFSEQELIEIILKNKDNERA